MATKKTPKKTKRADLSAEAARLTARKRFCTKLKGMTDEDIRDLAAAALEANHPDRVPFPKDVTAATAAHASSVISSSSMRSPHGFDMLELVPITHADLLGQFKQLPLVDLLKLNKALHQAIADAS